MTDRVEIAGLRIARELHDFVDTEAVPGTGVGAEAFWSGLSAIVHDLAPKNRALLATRDEMQDKLDRWYRDNGAPGDMEAYKDFLKQIGYLVPEGPAFAVTTDNVDAEIATVAGPQLVVPITNARYALNAANARWGSLYDALYGTDAIPEADGAGKGRGYNPVRGQKVIAWAKDFLDASAPLKSGSWADAGPLSVRDGGLVVGAAGPLSLPLAGAAILAFLVAGAATMTVPGTKRTDATQQREQPASQAPRWLVPKLLSVSFIVSAGIGVFEVGLALRGKQELGLTPYQIAMMFTECSLVMFVAQAIVFSPWIKPETTRWFVAPALSILAAGLFLVPRASNFALMLGVIGAVAASAGILSPILTYWISRKAGNAQGAELGKQTAAASLGAAVGSAVGGLLFNVAWLPNASFLLVTVLTLLGIVLSLGLPNQLVPRRRGKSGADDGRPMPKPLNSIRRRTQT